MITSAHLPFPPRCGKNIRFQEEESQGFITLSLVLLVGAVSASIAVSLLLSGVGFSLTALAVQESRQARALANACAERALETIRENNSFSGNGSYPLGAGSCTYFVTVLTGENRTVDAVGTVGEVVAKIKVEVNAIKPIISIAEWREVSD